jgi:PhzF family phenazine biosynthesis protein
MFQAISVVDAFTDRPFSGNPAAVCVLPHAADERWMRAVAAEMNLSETAFLHPEGDGYRLRWLTPAIEVDLCGHATLASAHVLWERGRLAPDERARFYTRSGLLTAERDGARIVLDFPVLHVERCDEVPGLADALGTALPLITRAQDGRLLVLLDSVAAVRALVPDFRALRALAVRGVIVTAASDDARFDFVSRYFAPAAGVDEDPVTGSAHCALAPFWSARLGGKDELIGYQASARGGIVHTRVRGERVLLGGLAVIVQRGEILGPEAAPGLTG